MINVAVESVIVGAKGSEAGSFEPVELNLVSERIAVRDLIYRTVQQQVDVYLKEKKEESEIIQKMINRLYLSNSEIEKQAKEGAIHAPDHTKVSGESINIDKEYKKAISCFNGNIYKLLIDGETMEELDQAITLTPESKIIFIRLTPLVGG
jgi:hypothetical protein